LVMHKMKIPLVCCDIKSDRPARPAVFMDRDGTINEQMGYINDESRFVLLGGVAEGIRLLNTNGYLAVVVSNQSGVARGYFPLELVFRVNRKMQELLEAEGAYLDAVFFCPHHKNGSVPGFSISCDCRKPLTGLFDKACGQMSIDLSRSYVIGDRCTDIEFAESCGIPGILVETGYGLGERQWVLPEARVKPVHIAADLTAAVKWIIQKREL
jgi:D-glycero-D-manno-heptose 1,7-bisphosphate phosphatase